MIWKYWNCTKLKDWISEKQVLVVLDLCLSIAVISDTGKTKWGEYNIKCHSNWYALYKNHRKQTSCDIYCSICWKVVWKSKKGWVLIYICQIKNENTKSSLKPISWDA